ncbi:hypothetical protein HYDPIDRAFT_111286 [Hydnomerulius pinastri MD-312]|uniref:Nucleoporin Nup54 alpha-helical domain-containing protein n=1 Tax=Hydnomerulius pinastri MD-312 TaxID=994086 RepID=A0A0C9W1G3_9AGAM|nr:hypothetical protein HYDPIDRAFT_111286 [Hydnomerulius pinastri MD-312]
MSAFGTFGQTPAGGSIFGGGTTNTQQGQNTGTGAGSSIFGNPPPAAGGSIFGNTGTGATGGGSLFGNTQQQQQQQQPATGGGIFGNTQQQQPATGGSIFGNTQQQQQQPAPGGSIFGNTTTQPGGLFGSSNTQQQQTTGGSLFGNTQQQPAGGSLFGNTQQQQQPTGSLFGNTNNQQQQPASGGGLFGSTATQQQPTTSLFGNTTQAPAAGGLFGSTTSTTQAPGSGGGLFGSMTGSSNPLFGNKSPSSIFGSQTTGAGTTNTITPPSLFGQPPAQNTTTQPTTSLFGQPVQQQQQQQQQQKPLGSLFGSTTQSSGTGSLFGSTLAPPSSGFGSGSGSTLGASRSPMTVGSSQQQDPHSQFVALTQRIDAIAEAWNSNSPQCRFQHYFYNLVDPSQVSQYGRPPNATNEALWQRAVRENPDPSCMVPVLALGFDALNVRVEAQSAQATAQQEKLKELKKRLQSLTATHNDTTLARVHRALSQQTHISHRLLKLIQHLHLLIPAVRSSSIRPEEEALRVALEDMEEDIRRPGGMSKMRGKLNELWALVGAVNAARERGRKVGGDAGVEWTVVDEEGLKQITQILSDQQAGLQHLTKILQRDLKDLGVIMGTNGEGEDSHMSTENRFSGSTSTLYSSTSTLHASALR